MAYIAPTSVEFTGYKGFYSGASILIKGDSSYKYLYVADTSKVNPYTYYRKITNFSGSCTLTLQSDTSYTENKKKIYVVLSNQDLTLETTFGDSTKAKGCDVPRFAMRVYKGSSSPTIYNSNTHANIYSYLTYSGYSFDGLTYDSTSYYDDIGPDWDVYGPQLDGNTLYAIFQKTGSSFTGTYYCGSAKRTTSVTIGDEWLYGTGQTYGGDISIGSMNTTCSNNSSYSLQGWAVSKTTTVKYNNAVDAFAAGHKTIYGIYYKAGSGPTTNTVYYYRGSSAKQSVSETVTTTDGWYYYTGTKSGGTATYTYGTISTSCLGDSSYSLDGWTGNSNSTDVEYEDAEDALRHYNTIYGIYSKTESMTYYPNNGESTNSVPVTNYRYGGSNQVTCNIPTEPSLTYDGHTFSGWSITSNGTTNTWVNQWNGGVRTVYAIWTRDGNIYYCPVGSNNWISAETYKGVKVNGVLQWVPIQTKYGSGNTWK